MRPPLVVCPLLVLLASAAPCAATPATQQGTAVESAGMPPVVPIEDPHDRLTTLLERTGEPEALAEVMAMLDTDDERLQLRIVMGITTAFPAEARGAFEALANDDKPHVRAAAARGLGHLPDGELAIDRLIELLHDPEQIVRQGAVYGLTRPSTEARVAARRVSVGRAKDIPARALQAIELTRLALIESLDSTRSQAPEELYAVLSGVADYETAQILMDDYRRHAGRDDAFAAKLLGRMQRSNRNWLGKAVVPPMEKGSLSLSVFQKDPVSRKREHELHVTSEAIRQARRLGENMDRAMRLQLPLDGLATVPQVMNTKAERLKGGRALVRYTPKPRAVKAGFGAGGSFVWLARLAPESSELTLEKRRGLPLEERLFDADGLEITRLIYGDWIAVERDSWVPGTITVEFPDIRIADADRHLRYDLRFEMREGLWMMVEGAAVEIVGDRERTLCTSELLDYVATPPTGDAKPNEG